MRVRLLRRAPNKRLTLCVQCAIHSVTKRYRGDELSSIGFTRVYTKDGVRHVR